MCVAVRLAAGWLTTAVARVEQREREREEKRDRKERLWEKERESHWQIKSKRKIECTKERVCEREGERERWRGGGTRALKQAAHRHRSSRSSILIHISSSCLFSNLSLFSIPPSVSVLQAAKMLALPPPFVLQWERECTADALLSAAQPASEQCIGLMQCSCVLTHSTSPPPASLLLPPLTVTIFSSLPRLLSVSHMFCPSPSFCTLTLLIALPVPIFPSLLLSVSTPPPPNLSLKLKASHSNVSYRDKRSDSTPTPEWFCVLSLSVSWAQQRASVFQWSCGLLLFLTSCKPQFGECFPHALLPYRTNRADCFICFSCFSSSRGFIMCVWGFWRWRGWVGVRDIIEDWNADSASLCLLGSLLFREEKDERACTQLSLRKMREKDGEIEEKRLTERVGGGGVGPGMGRYIHVLGEIGKRSL